MKKLTRKEKRIKIAEACGYIHYGCIGCAYTPCVCTGYLTPGNDPELVYELPDYFNDLNAMHEAEKVLNNDHWDVYCDHLGGSLRGGAGAPSWKKFEAFGLTLGLWEAGQ